MSLLLAPYNNAMRLGMGFNSYTQSLCINDAVQKPNGVKASEDDLKVVKPALPGEPGSQVGQDGYGKSSGSEVRVLKDGQYLVSQTVTWEAKFIDKISDVTESMNISGSLAIKVDAIGGGGAAEGHYIDSNKFKESDLNYMISVKVTNQQLVADDVTEFCPIRNVQTADFTSVYGDSYISGFLEGGVFNAIVSVKLKDKSAVKDFGGGLAVKLGFSGVSVEGQAKGGKKSEDTSMSSDTTITVSWSGGGDIKPDDIVDWDIASLKKVAMEFPDRVASCPQRTSAIITKYTGLRSFYEQSIKGSPLEYENAGVYTSALLDAYMDYKSIWKQLATTIWEVDNSISELTVRKHSDELQEYAEGAEKDYAQKLKDYEQSKQSNQLTRQSGHSIEKPMAPNKVVPYTASVFGLDKAKRDCRFEMIKIVREVDAVTVDPAIAVDVNRAWQYLSPIAFRRLIPITSNIRAEEDKLKAKQDAEALRTKNEENLQLARRPQSGRFMATDHAWAPGVNSSKEVLVTFPQKFLQPPRMIHGLNFIDTEKGSRAAVSAITSRQPTNDVFGINVSSFGGCHAWNIGVSWMTLPDDMHIECGTWDTAALGQDLSDNSVRVGFSSAFHSPPKVLVWFQEVNAHVDWFSLMVRAEQVDSQGFSIRINSWANRRYSGARVGWLAYPSEEDGKRCRADRNKVERAAVMAREHHPWYSGPFSRAPAASFIAISELDYGCNANVRLQAVIEEATAEKLKWSYGTWADSNMDHAEVTWLAIE